MKHNSEDLSEVLKELGKRVKTRRNALRLSQQTVANTTGIARTYLSDIERGVTNASIVILATVARSLNMPLSELVRGLDLSADNRNGVQ